MYWQQRFDRVDPDLQIRIAIEDIRKDHPNYGYRRLLPLLRSRGIVINKKRLQRIMQKFNLQVIAFSRKSRKYNSYKGVKGRIAPNRALSVDSIAVNHIKKLLQIQLNLSIMN